MLRPLTAWTLAIVLLIAASAMKPAGAEQLIEIRASTVLDEGTPAKVTRESGGWLPRLITVRQGEMVTLRITAVKGAHELVIPAFGVDTHRIAEGQTVQVEFVADRAGTFPFTCEFQCGPRHVRMRGSLIVKPSLR